MLRNWCKKAVWFLDGLQFIAMRRPWRIGLYPSKRRIRLHRPRPWCVYWCQIPVHGRQVVGGKPSTHCITLHYIAAKCEVDSEGYEGKMRYAKLIVTPFPFGSSTYFLEFFNDWTDTLYELDLWVFRFRNPTRQAQCHIVRNWKILKLFDFEPTAASAAVFLWRAKKIKAAWKRFQTALPITGYRLKSFLWICGTIWSVDLILLPFLLILPSAPTICISFSTTSLPNASR